MVRYFIAGNRLTGVSLKQERNLLGDGEATEWRKVESGLKGQHPGRFEARIAGTKGLTL